MSSTNHESTLNARALPFGKTRHAPPRASAMLESLRGLGYSTEAALADVIDNSISAGANTINIQFTWDGQSSNIYVLDNGSGMSDEDLESAMTLGDKNPLDARSAHDLGRFGMGLKTASLSQCKRLTVASKKGDSTSCLRWDLDVLTSNPNIGWGLIEGPAPGSEALLEKLTPLNHGTMVIWEVLDRIVTSGFTVDNFLSLMEEHVERHLAMIFHRLIEGTHPKLQLQLNGRKIEPWDPFLSGHPAKPWASPIQRHRTAYGDIEVQCHVLPHRDKLTDREYEISGGPAGWNAQQGFYVYRNQRLLVAGGWLGLGQPRAWNREEPHRLARIRLDIPNTADADWKIDVKKSVARPPVALRAWLTQMATDTRERARRVFAFRGSPTITSRGTPIEQAWKVERTSRGIQYKIDDSHPSIASVLDSVNPTQKELVHSMLRVIEETVPVQKIWLDTAEQKETPVTSFASSSDEAVIGFMKTLFNDMLIRKGMTIEDAKAKLACTDPFQNFPHLIAQLAQPDE
jgi:Histidine kinase-, DNA gyrase B-, and HSP90-like ATPase